jgi:antitoxin FitA
MTDLTVNNVDEVVVQVLKNRAAQHGISAEAEHQKILQQALLQPPKKSFAEVLSLIPNVGHDSDFERVQDVS